MPLLSLLPDQERGRVKRDRLELLTALIGAPTFDALFRADIVNMPPDHPVFGGNACPWKLDCENCDHFVLSGADLLYWRRKQEQWRSIAERAPDDATADYLHHVFEPTARAIDGLEKALTGLGLLEEALNHDLRRPQDYFHRLWSTSFRAAELVQLDSTPPATDTKIGGPV